MIFEFASLRANKISLGSQKVKRSVGNTVLQNFRACLPHGQKERNVNAKAKDSSLEGVSLIQTNKQLFSRAFLGFKPQLIGQLHPTWLTESQRFQEHWNDNKEKSGSQGCGLKWWVFGYASLSANAISLDLRESKGLSAALCFKRSVGSTVLQKVCRQHCASGISACLSLWQPERMHCRHYRDSCRKLTTLQ